MNLCVLPHDEPAEPLPGLLVCGRHRHKLDDLTREVGLLIVDTCRILDGGAPSEASAKTKHQKIPEGAAPGNLAIMALYDSRTLVDRIPDSPANPGGDQSEPMLPVLNVVSSWLLMVAEERPLSGPLPASVLAQLDLLARHLEWLAAHPAVDDYWTELGDVLRYLRDVTNDHTHHRVATCDLPTPDGRKTMLVIHKNRAWRIVRICGGAITVRNGDDVWRCVRCRATWITDQQKARFAVKVA